MPRDGTGDDPTAGPAGRALLVDTHCHLADAAFDGDLGSVMTRAWAAVGHVVVIGETPERARRALELTATETRLSATVGLHPHEATRWNQDLAAVLESVVSHDHVVAVGETGLDFHYDHSPRDRQLEAFEGQLDLARRSGKPAVIHARKADDAIGAVLRNHPKSLVIMHSYSSGDDLLDCAVALGHYISFSGMLTFKSWVLDDAVRRVPRDRLLVETDAPYLAPVPFRGKRNEPAFVSSTAARLAAVLELRPDEVAALTTRNAARAFGPRIARTTTTDIRSVP